MRVWTRACAGGHVCAWFAGIAGGRVDTGVDAGVFAWHALAEADLATVSDFDAPAYASRMLQVRHGRGSAPLSWAGTLNTT